MYVNKFSNVWNFDFEVFFFLYRLIVKCGVQNLPNIGGGKQMIHIRRETQIMEKHTLGKTQIFTSDADYEGEALGLKFLEKGFYKQFTSP